MFLGSSGPLVDYVDSSKAANIAVISVKDEIELPSEYADYAKVFSAEEADKLLNT